jgi:Winged helix DNA-binding domain
MSAAELALWARIENLEPDAVAHALWEERSLIKTWAMRGTLHLLPSSELHLWQVVPGLDRRYLRPAWQRYFGITAEELERLTAAVAEALDGQVLTREELIDEASRRLGSEELGAKLRFSWGNMLKPAAFRCLLCFGPSLGQKARFAGPESWLGSLQLVDEKKAEQEVTRRFLATYGPATRDVYAQWLGIARRRAGSLITALADEVAAVEIEGTSAWALTSQLGDIAKAQQPRSLRLLPAFDQYVLVASRDAANFLPGPFRDRIYRPQGWLSPVLLVDGRMDGIWRYERKGSRVHVQIEPFLDLPPWARQAAEKEAESLAKFLSRDLELNWTSPRKAG